jgi:hypothetical protein
MPYSLVNLSRLYLQIQSAFGTIPNSSGTATVAASNACKHISFDSQNSVASLVRRDRTGTRTATQAASGRRHSSWNGEWSWSPNGTQAVVPDVDPVLQATFGQAATTTAVGTSAAGASTAATPSVLTVTGHGLGSAGVYVGITLSGHSTSLNGPWVAQIVDANSLTLIGSTSSMGGGTGGTIQKGCVKYALSDNIMSFVAYQFRQPSTINQRVSFGNVVSRATFNFGADVAEFTAEGEGLWTLETDLFSGADTYQKGGLTAMPSEPASPVTNGPLVAGFTGKAILNGGQIAEMRTSSITINTGNQAIKDLFGSYYPDSAEGDERNIELAFSMYEADTTAQQTLRQYGVSKTAFDVVLQLGTVSGATLLALLRGVQIDPHTMDGGQRRFVNNLRGRAYGSGYGTKDEVTFFIV